MEIWRKVIFLFSFFSLFFSLGLSVTCVHASQITQSMDFRILRGCKGSLFCIDFHGKIAENKGKIIKKRLIMKRIFLFIHSLNAHKRHFFLCFISFPFYDEGTKKIFWAFLHKGYEIGSPISNIYDPCTSNKITIKITLGNMIFFFILVVCSLLSAV